PMTLKNEDDYDKIPEGASVRIDGFKDAVANSDKAYLTVGEESYELCLNLTERQREILLAGGMLNYTKNAK
ncbi:MAG: aconitate hydratase, partial [Clostridia bacterium]|nr:aconitate hydratase [Clostridia bacterium]